MKKAMLLLACGLAAGAVNGFLGSGGGIIIILSLSLMRKKGVLGAPAVREGTESGGRTPGNTGKKDDFATAIAAILPMSAVSMAAYGLENSLDWKRALIFALPAAAGGVVGALLLDRIKTNWLQKLFAVLLTVSGIIMIVR